MAFPFHKMQGAGNDFIVVRGDEHDWSALAPALCDRHRGIGSDGILVALPSDNAGVRMRMYNPDGTEDECGNGLRCLVRYAHELGLINYPAFSVETLSGIRACEILASGLVRTELGRADLRPSAVPVNWPKGNALGFPLRIGAEEVEAYSLSTGTAHTVIFDMPDEERFQRLSPRIEVHRLFPERTSILWAKMESKERARVRIWERGVGETLACGTGAAAVAAAAYVTERSGPRVEVTSRGGTLTVEVSDDLDITLTGPAQFVFEGEWLER
jgi:diaminopimelate epimerase